MENTAIQTELKKFSITDVAIANMKKDFMPLKINGLADLEGYAKVKEAKNIVKAKRIDVEKKRVELKADSIKFGNAVDAEAKRIKKDLLEIEEYLEAEQKRIDDEKEQIKQKAQREKEQKIQKRINLLSQFQANIKVEEVWLMDDAQFDVALNKAQTSFEELQKQKAADELQRVENEKRILKMEADQKIEREKLAKIALEQEERAKALKIAEDRINAMRPPLPTKVSTLAPIPPKTADEVPPVIAIPEQLKAVNIKDLRFVCKEYMEFVYSDRYNEDNSVYTQYIFETALVTIYGPDIFTILNKKRLEKNN